jgi:hypothetical protein
VSHVTRRELARFVSRGEASEAFVAHVDDCPLCASTLAGLARSSLAASRPLPAEGLLVALVLAVAVMVWPRPALEPRGARDLAEAEAGVPDSGPPLRSPPLLTVASLDGGRAPLQR